MEDVETQAREGHTGQKTRETACGNCFGPQRGPAPYIQRSKLNIGGADAGPGGMARQSSWSVRHGCVVLVVRRLGRGPVNRFSGAGSGSMCL